MKLPWAIEHRPVACPECKSIDRFHAFAQEISVDALRLAVRVERVLVVCRGCKGAFEIERGAISRYRGQVRLDGDENPAPPADGKSGAPPEESDSDLPMRFRGKR